MVYRVRGRMELARERARGDRPYTPTPAWEKAYHRALGAPWPCDHIARFHDIWRALADDLQGMGHGHDADPALARAVWCGVIHTQPDRAVEIGVARGISTRFLLEAIAANGKGRLWSIDLPPLLEGWRAQVAVAVPPGVRGSWEYVRGPSGRVLPRLLERLGEIDFFLHDGLHTEPTLERELPTAWSRARSGAALLVDGIHRSEAFRAFGERAHPATTIIAPHEEKRGYLGIVLKDA
jgi:hypothetical protein